ncbi:ABC transporter permease [Marinobacter salarius]|uniref:ABC transporter permease n=1 Tax=Marinobacter salarius TaxID=1420917 RepID=UPI0032EAFEF5
MHPSEHYLLGTDNFGRDTFSRILHGGRVSLSVAFLVAIATSLLGIFLGVMAGYVRWLDGVLMRIMDGLMAIPGILLAIALMTVMEASLLTVVFAITITEIPRMTRLARAATLGVRNMLYIEAAVTVGTRFFPLLWRHILPNIAAPLLVQATFVAASAILLEAYLGFLGAGIPPEVPSWGNMIAQGRTFVQVSFGLVLYPSLLLAAVVLSINVLGDFLRDVLDPRMTGRK